MPRMELSCTFKFAAAHFLTKYHGKCENLHGHNYKMIITIEGEMQGDGMVMDYKIIKKIVNEKVVNKIDHTLLNDIMDNPSSELFAIWTWNELIADLPMLKSVEIFETEKYRCKYEGK